MRIRRNNILAVFVIALMFASIFSTILISYRAEKGIPTGKSVDQGQVTITVPDATSPPVSEVPSPAGGGGGGGGPDEEGVPEEFNLDFRLDDTYTIDPVGGDTINIIFSDSVEYSFDVFSTTFNWIVLEIMGSKYTIDVSEIGYFDLDSDGVDDLKVVYERDTTTFVSLYIPKEGEVVEAPKLTKRKIAEDPLFAPSAKLSYVILLIVAVIILVVLTYQHVKLSGLEKGHEKKIKKMYKVYKANKETSSRREGMVDKLEKQKELLDKAYQGKHISKKAYDAGKSRINKILRQIRKK